MMIAGQTNIDLSAFPRLQDTTNLVDVMYKVIFQNPYILSVNQMSYEPESKTLVIEYSLTGEEIAQRQKEISSAATSILSTCVREGMTEEEKIMAIWNKLEDDTSYDDEACKAGEESNFTNVDSKYADAFNTYGIMCKKKGVCQSYAMAYKLLLAETGINAKVLTGYLNKTLPHAWSIINVGGRWYWFDLTNNAKNSGLPYMLYEDSSKNAEALDYVLDDRYDIDSNLSWVVSDDGSRNFYNKNGLVAATPKDLPDKVVAARKLKRHGAYAVYVESGVTQNDLTQEIMTGIAQKLIADGMKENELQNLKFGCAHNFVIFIEE